MASLLRTSRDKLRALPARRKILRVVTIFSSAWVYILTLGGFAEASITLPAPVNNVTAILYGDLWSYSLALLNEAAGFGTIQPGEPFAVQSTPGKIQDLIVVLTGASGSGVNDNTDPGGLKSDNAFVAPSGQGSPSYFRTGNTTSGLEFHSGSVPNTNNSSQAEDVNRFQVDTAALRTVVGTGNQLLFFFNLNEDNSNPPNLDGQDILAWAQIDLIDLSGMLPTKTYYLTSDLMNSQINGGPDETSLLGTGISNPLVIDSRWVYVYGIITVDASGNFLHFGPPIGSDPPGSKAVNQNLGADLAAFALYSEELSNLVMDPNSGYDVLSADIRLARLSNGYEQIFVMGGQVSSTPEIIPEPSTSMIYLGMIIGLCYRCLRRRNNLCFLQSNINSAS